MSEDNYSLSVGCVVIREEQVLLVRHTYGSAKGQLLIPGGYCKPEELPEETARREVLEETQVAANPIGLLALRCRQNSWYAVLLMQYEAGEATSDKQENNEAIFMDLTEAIEREDVTQMTKVAIELYLEKKDKLWLQDVEYQKVSTKPCAMFDGR